MAASSLLWNNPNFNPCSNSFSKNNFYSTPYGSVCFTQKFQFHRSPVVKASKKQIELADEVDKEAPLSMLTLFSPCKINVFLRITSKRADGYHDLASLFHIIKALNLFRKKTGTNKYFWIHLDKKVPTGAGLGGGSSNAATALWAANQFSGGLATEEELQEWSGEIGSDIPFFFSHGAAYCTGRGEVVEDMASPIALDIPMVLVKPPQACPTGEVYKFSSGSTIVDIGSPDPPQFVYDDEEYQDVFLTEGVL
ncbi:unnamed protein product [Linum tenue]|uniref:GHMP kinase N-terminal domain-containing protein n=2 Tax=Linum tenue TaxID=586396 RepID=A0AAV0QT26_9ROSI|nr:unnamed protein product [Linum tenue]